jgi:hypothetical protein
MCPLSNGASDEAYATEESNGKEDKITQRLTNFAIIGFCDLDWSEIMSHANVISEALNHKFYYFGIVKL